MKITWHDKIPDTDVFQLAKMTSLHTMINKIQLQWSGNVITMDDGRLPKRLSYGELASGKRSTGGQFKHNKDSLKVSLKNFGIDPDKWETKAMERATWRIAIHNRAIRFESSRLEKAREKRANRRLNMENGTARPTNSEFVCHMCHKQFWARIGLIGHLRTHQPRN